MRRRALVAVLIPLALGTYAAIALALGAWASALAAALVATLLWRRHPRARFAAYIFLTVLVVRGVLRGPGAVSAFAIVIVLALQLPRACAEWPRLRPGFRR